MIQVLTREEVRTEELEDVEAHTFRDSIDSQPSYWELPHVLGDKSVPTTNF